MMGGMAMGEDFGTTSQGPNQLKKRHSEFSTESLKNCLASLKKNHKGEHFYPDMTETTNLYKEVLKQLLRENLSVEIETGGNVKIFFDGDLIKQTTNKEL